MHLSLSLSRYSSPENMPLRSPTIESITDQGAQLLGIGIHHLNVLGPHLPMGCSQTMIAHGRGPAEAHSWEAQDSFDGNLGSDWA